MNTSDSVWILVSITLVFSMQAGFAMVETGFTRAKNAGNIIMKNLIDFCIGTVVFLLLGYGLMHGDDLGGFIGTPINIFGGDIDWMHLMFNLVFAATAATIVSGAMAERTKSAAYCIYSAVISLFIYPVSGHWIWGGGWLAQLGFVDFAGSTAVHLVGGLSALIGAAILGPRIGKYVKDRNGKTLVKAIPGHSLTLGALGVFLLWFGWYGFNGGSTYGVSGGLDSLAAKVMITTSVAASVATIVTVAITWIKYKKPDVSMALNGALAGLVAITAGCATVSVAGAAIIGAISAFVLVFGVEFIDKVLHVDDPVGAVGVHCFNGALGTVLVGVFSQESGIISGFIYNDALTAADAFKFFGVQILGVVAVAAWVGLTVTALFLAIKKTVGIRVSKHDELIGLDISEHGLPAAYADFMPMTTSISTAVSDLATAEDALPVSDAPYDGVSPLSEEEAVPVTTVTKAKSGKPKFTKIVIIANPTKFENLVLALDKIGITGMTATSVTGCGLQRGNAESYYRGVKVGIQLMPKTKVELVVSKVPVKSVVDAAKKALYTGNYGDGKIFIYEVENVIKIRTGEEGVDALQDDPSGVTVIS
jgi:Amt family ammonium transporter